MNRSCHPVFVAVLFVAPALLPLWLTAGWVNAMGVGSSTERFVFQSIFWLAILVFVAAAISFVVCIVRGSSDQRKLALIAIPAAIPISILANVLLHFVLPREFWV